MAIPQLQFELYFSNIISSIIYFLLFSGVYRIFLYPIYKKINNAKEEVKKNEKLLHLLKIQGDNLLKEIDKFSAIRNQQQDVNDFIKNEEPLVTLKEYNNEEDEYLNKQLKMRLKLLEKAENLSDILKD
jgi:hypothetical protein